MAQSKARPAFWRWQRAIRGSSLSNHEKHVAWVMFTYADLETGGSIRPSVKQVALDTSLSERMVRDVIHCLLKKGILIYDGPPSRGRACNRYVMSLQRLEAHARKGIPATDQMPVGAVNPANGAVQPGTNDTDTRQDTSSNPAQRAAHLSNELPKELANHPTSKARSGRLAGAVAVATGGSRKALLAAMSRYGFEGDLAEMLADSGFLDPAMIEAEARWLIDKSVGEEPCVFGNDLRLKCRLRERLCDIELRFDKPRDMNAAQLAKYDKRMRGRNRFNPCEQPIPALERALSAYGITGDVLSELSASCDLSTADIRDTALDIDEDDSIEKPTAVLIHRLRLLEAQKHAEYIRLDEGDDVCGVWLPNDITDEEKAAAEAELAADGLVCVDHEAEEKERLEELDYFVTSGRWPSCAARGWAIAGVGGAA